MKNTTHIGSGFNWALSACEIPSSNYFVFFHGSGEWGNIDGSQISRLFKYGYPQLAYDNTLQFPFNILSVQGTQASNGIADFRACQKGVFDLLKTLGATNIILAGLSQGGEVVLDYLFGTYGWSPNDPNVAGVISFAGKFSGSPIWNNCRPIDVLLVHHKLDNPPSGNPYMSSYKGTQSLLAEPSRTNSTKLITLTEATNSYHADSWTHGMNPNDDIAGKEVYQFCLDHFGQSIPVNPTFKQIDYIDGSLIATLSDGTKLKVLTSTV